MQRIIVLVLLLFCVGSQANTKLSPRVTSLLSGHHSRTRNTEDASLWIFFHDKGPYYNELSDDQLHPKTLWRRNKVMSGPLVDEDDLPVYEDYILQVKTTGVVVRRSSKWLNAISITVASSSDLHETIQRITEFSFVSRVDVVASYAREVFEVPEKEVKEEPASQKRATTLNYGSCFAQLDLIGAPLAHAMGYNGSGVTVVILDSGFMKSHPALRDIHIVAEYDFLDNDNNTDSNPPDAQVVHGTATLSNLGGWAPGNVIGSGFGASFLLAKTENTSAELKTEEDNFIAALEWAESLGAEVVSASLGYSAWYTYYDMDGTVAPVTIACDKAVRKGMVVVVSAGNSGTKGVAAPADGFEVISVGAVSQAASVTAFSSLGPSSDGRTKPEVVAQGLLNWAANAYGAPSRPNAAYYSFSGTSFSCPLVAGVVAILLQAHPDWTPAMVREALLMTAVSSYQPSDTIGWGVVDTIGALHYNPIAGNCTTGQCSNSGCCNDETGSCQCVSSRFGPSCNFPREPCATFCSARTSGKGQCLLQPSGLSFRCGSPTVSKDDNTVEPSCAGCPVDVCGVCFGFNSTCQTGCDGVSNSSLRFDACHVCGGDNSTCATPMPTSTPKPTTTTAKATTGSSNKTDTSSGPNALAIALSVIGGALLVTLLSATVIVLVKRMDKNKKAFRKLPLDHELEW